MADLTLDDLLKPKLAVKPVNFAGKTAYIRELSFDAQIEISEKFSDKADQEANAQDMKRILAYTLSDKDGNLLFKSPDQAVDVLGNMPGHFIVELFNEIQAANGLNVEEEIKN